MSWLGVLAAVLILQISAATWLKAGESKPQSQNTPVPKVLGAISDLRGQAEPNSKKLVVPFLTQDDLAGISAKSFLVYSQTGGETVAEKNSAEKLPIASLTKLMTGLLAYDNLDFNQTITIKKQGLTNVKPIVNFANGDEILTGDIFDAMVVGSCNDAAQVLGNQVAQTTDKNIADLMNAKATELGMSNSNFSNPLGFDIGSNYSTAEDLKKLVDASQAYAVFSNLGQKQNLEFGGSLGYVYKVSATNKLLAKHSDIQAVKTGYTESSQGSMVIKINKDGQDFIVIVLNSQNRELDALKLKQLVVDKLQWE